VGFIQSGATDVVYDWVWRLGTGQRCTRGGLNDAATAADDDYDDDDVADGDGDGDGDGDDISLMIITKISHV